MDFSANAFRALKGAKQLFRPDRGDEIIVFAVPIIPLLDRGDDFTAVAPPDLMEEAVNSCLTAMEHVHQECKDIMGHYTCEVSQPAGDAREVILMRLERKGEGKIDYAVCGQRGRSRVKDLLLGNVALHLSHYAPTSVVIVK